MTPTKAPLRPFKGLLTSSPPSSPVSVTGGAENRGHTHVYSRHTGFGVFVVIVGVMTSLVGGFSHPEKADYRTHPCIRGCLGAGPATCTYNFTVEHYETLSRACYGCPGNVSDCFRPHCIPADGRVRTVKVVNRMIPGPAIHACKGDRIVVNVYNAMGDFEGTSIHWHGIRQRGAPHMDGVAMVTQCPITSQSVFQYSFVAEDAGTHYWHAHAGMQRGDGIFGALVIRDTEPTAVMRLYDHDLPEHTIIVHDWLDGYASVRFSGHHHGQGDNQPSSILINGRGTFQSGGSGVPTDQAINEPWGTDDTPTGVWILETGTAPPPTKTPPPTTVHGAHGDSPSTMDAESMPHSVFRVTFGMRYRWRVISNGVLNCPLKLSVESHRLTIIASDGFDMTPVDVDSLTIFAGERYDVVIRADQSLANYWIHVIGLGDCRPKNASQTAILRYALAPEIAPSTGQGWTDGDRPGINANPMDHNGPTVKVSEMTSDQTFADVLAHPIDKKFYFAMDFNKVENYRYVNPELYPLSAMLELHPGGHSTHLFALQMNHITFTMPASPILSQYGDLAEEIFCNETSAGRDCSQEFCECVHRVVVGVGDHVEMVLVSEARNGLGNHPMHLHGHSFWVLGMGKVNTSVTRRQIEEMDVQGMLQRNHDNPVQKDTVMVPDGGYTVIRFKADNPGFWLFHCHVDFHFALGMTVVVQVGEPHQMAPTPPGFPTCGNWYAVVDEQQETSGAQQETSGAQTASVYSAVVLLVVSVARLI